MVPHETEDPSPTTRSDGVDVADGDVASVSAPISALSKLALKEAMLEFEATVRKTRDASSAAALLLWHSAERRLGLEVDIDDPALRGLFSVHVLAVEDLLSRVRSQAEASLAAVGIWSQPPLGAVCSGLRLLGSEGKGDADLGEAGSDLIEADAAMGEASSRFTERLGREVFAVIDERLALHGEVREDVRERQRWRSSAAASLKDVAWLRKGSKGSGLRALSGRSSSSVLEDSEGKLLETMQMNADFDERLLQRLTNLQAESVDAVRRPWAALLQIQAEYFMAQQAIWAPLSCIDEGLTAGQTDTVC